MFLKVISQAYLSKLPVAPETLSDFEKIFLEENTEIEILDYEDHDNYYKLTLIEKDEINTWFVRKECVTLLENPSTSESSQKERVPDSVKPKVYYDVLENSFTPESSQAVRWDVPEPVKSKAYYDKNHDKKNILSRFVGGAAKSIERLKGTHMKRDSEPEKAMCAAPLNDEFPTRGSEPQNEMSENESTSQPSVLSRYPNLDCPDKVLLSQRFSLTVELLIEKPEDQPEIQALMIEDTQVDKLPEVEIVLSASGFDIEGSNTQTIEVERDDDSSVRFVLVPSKLGQHKIKVLFYQNGKPIGKAVRNILVSEQIVVVEVPQPNEPFELELKTLLTIPPQDLELLIDLDKENKTLSFSLHSVKEEIDYHRKECGKVILQGSPLDKMQVVYKEMTQLAQKMPTTSDEKEWAERRLESLGNELWDELIPQELKNEYWKFKSRVKSVLITSEEPWIPWEMLKPYRFNDDGKKENDLFWCQKFAVSRWLSGPGTADDLNIKTVRPIAPTQSNLPSVMDEIDFMERISGLRSSVTPLASFSTRTQVLDSLENEDLSILHFACHGMFDSTSPNNSAISLSGGALCPSDINVRFIGKRPRPLIFINACHGGRTEFSFTGLGGWAECFVNARAGAFIGAMWEVSDTLALQFAKTFYTAFLRDNQPIAEAFRQAREDIRLKAPYNSTWLAYTLYADPEGKVKT